MLRDVKTAADFSGRFGAGADDVAQILAQPIRRLVKGGRQSRCYSESRSSPELAAGCAL